MKISSILVALAVALGATAAVAETAPVQDAATAGDVSAGKQLSASCAACHGVNGISVAPDFPNLAGMSANYLHKQLENFKSGARKNAIMNPMVAALSDQNLRDLAAYYAAQPAPVPAAAPAADAATVARGERIYREGVAGAGVSACIRCHGVDGAGQLGHFPRLAGQHAKYLVTQLEAFKSGSRGNDAGKMMAHVVAGMDKQDMQAVAVYLQGLR
ncbi:c-type cytochrome [Acidihalobacter prosperus]|uniref:Cytochrome c domain-containing protein n=1 Tax=Acidihalobacter prosperus TaxID=160660 RepID=A0A1A6C3T5_9GAMM|nr:c-type cytochrome [Acidihalobacter prosperus]OBS09205.1 hypothetical protein Thpro_021533 [Acidihalobacter prosperus]